MEFQELLEQRFSVRSYRPDPVPLREINVHYQPAGRSVHVSYRLVQPAEVSARLYTLNGKLAGVWSALPSGPGWQQATLPLSELKTGIPGGLCILELRLGAWSESRKLLIMD